MASEHKRVGRSGAAVESVTDGMEGLVITGTKVAAKPSSASAATDEKKKTPATPTATATATAGVDAKVDDEEVLEVDFDFTDPVPSDWQAVKNLLQRNLGAELGDVDPLAKLISNQVECGSMVKAVSDRSSPLGFITILPFSLYSDSVVLERARSWLTARCDEKQRAQFSSFISSASSCGWLISERLINLPPQLLPPLLDALIQDVRFASTDAGVDAVTQKAFTLKHIMLISRVTELPGASTSGTSASTDWQWYHNEERTMNQMALLSFSFTLTGAAAANERRVVSVLEWQTFCSVVESQVNGMLGDGGDDDDNDDDNEEIYASHDDPADNFAEDFADD